MKVKKEVNLLKKINKDFVTNYFAWLSLAEQKERAEELQNMTISDKKERKYKKNTNN